MNKKDLIAVVADKTEMSKKDSEKAVNAVFEAVSQALAAGDKVQLAGFGAFDVKERPARECINPRTKETIKVEASKAVQFRVAKALKDTVNE